LPNAAGPCELTAELFREIVDAAAAPPGDGLRRDQRATPRTRLEVFATLLPFSDRLASHGLSVPVRDLSRGGFRFLHERPVPLGEHFGLLLPAAAGRPIVVLCTIAYWQPLSKGLYAVGARFSRILRTTETGLQLLLEPAVDPGESRRAS